MVAVNLELTRIVGTVRLEVLLGETRTGPAFRARVAIDPGTIFGDQAEDDHLTFNCRGASESCFLLPIRHGPITTGPASQLLKRIIFFPISTTVQRSKPSALMRFGELAS